MVGGVERELEAVREEVQGFLMRQISKIQNVDALMDVAKEFTSH